MRLYIVCKWLLSTAFVLAVGYASISLGASQSSQTETASGQLVAAAIRESVLFERDGDYAQALQRAQHALETDGRSYPAYARLAYLSWLTGDFTNAAALYRQATQLKPDSISAQLGLLKVLNAQGEYQQAEQHGHRILQTDFYNYYGNLGLLYALRQQGKYSLAIAIGEKMRKIYPDDVDVLLNLALVHYYADNSAKAQSLFDQVELYAPYHATVIYYRSQVFPLPVAQGSKPTR